MQISSSSTATLAYYEIQYGRHLLVVVEVVGLTTHEGPFTAAIFCKSFVIISLVLFKL